MAEEQIDSDPTFSVLLWYWQFSSLEVEDFDSVDEAVRSADCIEDGGGYPCGLEVAGPDGVEWVDEKALDALIREQRRQPRAEVDDEREPVHSVWLRPPASIKGEEDAVAWSSHDLAETERAADRLRRLYGAERVMFRRGR